MTLTQRLTRAGLVFVLLGTVAALLPTSGTANAATVTCTSDGQTYTLGQSSTDGVTAYTLGSGLTLTLNTYAGSTQTTATITASDITNFTNIISASSIKITLAPTTPATTTSATNTVSAVFGNGGPTLSVTVTVAK